MSHSRSSRQETASDEFASAPRGLRRVAFAARRRLRRLLLGRPQPPRRAIQDAYDWCLAEFAEVNPRALTERVAAALPQAERVAALFQAAELRQVLANLGRTAMSMTDCEADGKSGHAVPRDQLGALASQAFRSGDADAICWAKAALAELRQRQLPSGVLPAEHGASELAATLWFLEAAFREAQAAFATSAWDFPAEIAADDGRAIAVRTWATGLPRGAKVLDAGCGKGRYLRVLSAFRPDLRLVGVDAAPQALAALPADVEARPGSLLNLPVESGEFDAVLCVEALEHALLPRPAVTELCRALALGGKVLIIDKRRELQAESTTQPWETWFGGAEVSTWLSNACLQVAACDLEHGTPPQRRPLFLAWQGTRRGC